MTWKGGPYALDLKRVTNATGETVEYYAADSLQAYIKGLYRAAGLGAACSSHSGRRTMASRLIAAGESLETVALLLGHQDIDHVEPYIDIDENKLREMFEGVLDS